LTEEDYIGVLWAVLFVGGKYRGQNKKKFTFFDFCRRGTGAAGAVVALGLAGKTISLNNWGDVLLFVPREKEWRLQNV
jgi:hypothetical protein